MIPIPLLIALVYGTLYSMMLPDEFGFKRPIDPFYFSFTTMASVGYGDFSPKTDRAKVIVMSQQLVLIVGVVTVINMFMRVR